MAVVANAFRSEDWNSCQIVLHLISYFFMYSLICILSIVIVITRFSHLEKFSFVVKKRIYLTWSQSVILENVLIILCYVVYLLKWRALLKVIGLNLFFFFPRQDCKQIVWFLWQSEWQTHGLWPLDRRIWKTGKWCIFAAPKKNERVDVWNQPMLSCNKALGITVI